MSRFTRLCRAVGVGLAVAASTLSMTQVAHAALPSPSVPDTKIAVPAGNEAFLVGHVSTGVPIYKCDGTSWTFVAPRADWSTTRASSSSSTSQDRRGRRQTAAA